MHNCLEVDFVYMTMDQIHQEYDGQWVFMINCVKGEYGTLDGGEVVLHSYSKAEVVMAMEVETVN